MHGPGVKHLLDRLREYLTRYVELTDDQFEQLALLCRVQRVEKGSRVLAPGEVCAFEAFVANGCLRVYFSEFDGSERVLYFAPEGWLVTDFESYLSERPAALTIDAVETTDLLIIDKTSLQLLPTHWPVFERLFTRLAEQKLVALQKRMVACLRKTATERYREFRELYPGLDLRIPQYQIAAYIGVSAEFLSKLRKRVIRHK